MKSNNCTPFFSAGEVDVSLMWSREPLTGLVVYWVFGCSFPNPFLQLLVVDRSARGSMKTAAKCG